MVLTQLLVVFLTTVLTGMNLTVVASNESSVETLNSKLTALKSLVYKNAKATVTLNSADLLELSRLSADLGKRKTVSFSVFPKSYIKNLGEGQTVIFDHVLTNQGKGYDARTGVFVCSVPGTYIFVIDVLARGPLWWHLKVNQNIVSSAHISSIHTGGPWLQISRTVIVNLKQGDHVKIVNGKNKDIVHGGTYTGFSGALLTYNM